MAQSPLEAAIAETTNDPAIEWRSPQRAGMAYFRVILESLQYLMRRKGLPKEKAKQVLKCVSFWLYRMSKVAFVHFIIPFFMSQVTFIMRLQMISMARNDLHFVRSVSGSDARLIRMACEQLTYTSLKISTHSTPETVKLTDAQLIDIKKRVDEIGLCLFCRL